VHSVLQVLSQQGEDVLQKGVLSLILHGSELLHLLRMVALDHKQLGQQA
jgi:hypothetical protein